MQNVIKNNTTNKYRWMAGIIGVLAAGLGIWSFMNPVGSLLTMSWIFGILLIVGGAASIGMWFDMKNTIDRPSGLMINGILGIVIGGILLFTQMAGFIMMATLFAVWFIVDSCTWFSYADLSKYPTVSKFFSIIGVILGVFLLFSPVLSLGVLLFTVSFMLIFYGITAVVKAI